jgi:hypothetical protein
MRDYNVYGMFTLGESGEKKYFYVGRTEREIQLTPRHLRHVDRH